MKIENYHALTEHLQKTLEARSEVLALIALGSMAGTTRQPDEHSDHDFFVITETGKQEAYRNSRDWLPYSEQLVLHFRETDHGCKAFYRDGHLLEYAIFDTEELNIARINSYRVLFDRAKITEQMPSLVAISESLEINAQKRFDTMISNIMVGSMRAKRGELMSAHAYIKYYALNHFLTLCWHQLAPDSPHHDSLDPLRRFERQFTELALDLDTIMQGPILQAASTLLILCENVLAPSMPHSRHEAIAVFRDYIESEL